MHPHVAIQRHLLVGAVGAMRTRVRLPHLVLAGLVVVLVVRRVLLHARPMGAIESAMGLQSAGRAEADAARRTD